MRRGRLRTSLTLATAGRVAGGAVAVFVAIVVLVVPHAHAVITASAVASQDLATALLLPPTDVTTAAGTCEAGASDGAIVSWTPPTATQATAYEVLRATSSGGPYAVVGTATGSSASSYADSGLAFDSVYYYRLRSVVGGWQSANSAAVTHATRTSACA